MTPLALIIQARGGHVEGSDRALDQGRNAERFDFLRGRGVLLHPQDGSGISRASDPPPLKWSDLRYVFDIQEDCNGKKAIQA